jgi:nucleotide-binding universal stress UspA family protein
MNQLFKKTGLAITFSPTGKALLMEAKRISKLFNSELILIHVGEKTTASETRLNDIVTSAGLNLQSVNIFWIEGEPANAILTATGEAEIDLLIAGALEKEKLIKYYTGTIARKIMREAASSLLILKNPSENPKPFKKFIVSTDFTPDNERTVKITYEFAILDNAEEFTIVRDYDTPGLATTILDSASADDLQVLKNQWQLEEEEKMKQFVKGLNLKNINVKTTCLYGKEGWEASNFARENKADIFAVTAPQKKLKLIDRLFHHQLEYSFENLPSNLLIIR